MLNGAESFAVVGAGTLSLPILNALAAASAKDTSIILLSRPGSSTKTGIPPNVQVVQVDFTDAAAVAAVLQAHKVEVVLSTIGGAAATAQKPLVDAAKLAWVKLFVPSEYGHPTDGHTKGVLRAKNEIAEYVKSSGIPSLSIYNGLFIEFIPWLVDYSQGGKIKVVGKGETPLSVTSIPDVAGFFAHVLTTLPPSELENRILRVEGDRSTLNGFAPLFKTSIEHVDSITGEMGEFKTWMQHAMNAGTGSTGWDARRNAEGTGNDAAGSANALWPGHKWRSIKEDHNL
ncbi:NmrA domain-containing protein [Mycena venus]|uniref:NmrA domain-containing protein n=1 Tax=Mycena venus TaxID=2733690 RepID=A0A8H6XI75_9AGAR|nr:NmrA domain-containing protein [Mycena venus]